MMHLEIDIEETSDGKSVDYYFQCSKQCYLHVAAAAVEFCSKLMITVHVSIHKEIEAQYL